MLVSWYAHDRMGFNLSSLCGIRSFGPWEWRTRQSEDEFQKGTELGCRWLWSLAPALLRIASRYFPNSRAFKVSVKPEPHAKPASKLGKYSLNEVRLKTGRVEFHLCLSSYRLGRRNAREASEVLEVMPGI